MSVITKLKDAYRVWMALHRDFPKAERFGIGQKIEQAFLDTLELSYGASYLSPEHKITVLTKAISRLDILKFFLQLAWECKLVPTAKHAEITSQLEEVGRMLSGWKKGLEQKTPPKSSKEK